MNQRKLIWFAIAFSTVIYAVIAYTLGQPQRAFDESARQPITLALYAFAILMFLFAAVMGKRFRDRSAQLAMILALALYESCAIFALMAAFIAHDWRLYLPGWALALFGFMREWPGEAETATRPGSM